MSTTTVMTGFGPVEVRLNMSLHPKAVKLVEPDRDELRGEIARAICGKLHNPRKTGFVKEPFIIQIRSGDLGPVSLDLADAVLDALKGRLD